VERDLSPKALEDGLHSRHKTQSPPHSLVLYGLGGSSKSQLALRYVETHKRRYSHVFWINAANKEAAFDSFRAILADLHLPEIIGESALVRDTLKWFQQASGREAEWLVVIDNADDLS
jgi:predicted alpha/beta-fold hydrolase